MSLLEKIQVLRFVDAIVFPHSERRKIAGSNPAHDRSPIDAQLFCNFIDG